MQQSVLNVLWSALLKDAPAASLDMLLQIAVNAMKATTKLLMEHANVREKITYCISSLLDK